MPCVPTQLHAVLTECFALQHLKQLKGEANTAAVRTQINHYFDKQLKIAKVSTALGRGKPGGQRRQRGDKRACGSEEENGEKGCVTDVCGDGVILQVEHAKINHKEAGSGAGNSSATKR